jgi:hypothetical protein
MQPPTSEISQKLPPLFRLGTAKITQNQVELIKIFGEEIKMAQFCTQTVVPAASGHHRYRVA